MSKQAQIHKAKEDLNSVLKAVAIEAELQIEFDVNCQNNFFKWDDFLIAQKNNFLLPEINQSKAEFDENLLKDVRAASDMALCYFLFHQKKPKNQDENVTKFISDFERVRVLAKMKNLYLGAAKNILQKVENDVFSDSHNLSLLLLQKIFKKEILPRTNNFADELKEKLPKKILQQIDLLAEKIDNQEAFASEVTRLLEMILKESEGEKSEGDGKEEKKDSAKKQKEKIESFGAESTESENQEDGFEEEIAETKEQEIEKEDFAEIKDGEKIEEKTKQKSTSTAEEKIEFINAYKIFTSAFDEVILPQKLIAKSELEMLYDQLQIKLEKLSDISRKMSLKLKRKLLSKRSSLSEFDASRGILNRKKLTGIVLDPLLEDIWINIHDHEYQNTALTILLDNSGSMRGAPIVMSAMACKIIAEILEKFSVKVEIIGFTTVDWKGGRARKMWEVNGRIKNPGRLSELRHIIYKSFNQNFKKAQANLGLMLREGILKENIDGEALLFAKARLMQRNEKRKIMMVISDGTPIDDSTLAANDADILSNHLSHVVGKIEKSGKIEIIGIGIGHDTGNFYKNSMTIRNLEDLGDVMINKICEIL